MKKILLVNYPVLIKNDANLPAGLPLAEKCIRYLVKIQDELGYSIEFINAGTNNTAEAILQLLKREGINFSISTGVPATGLVAVVSENNTDFLKNAEDALVISVTGIAVQERWQYIYDKLTATNRKVVHRRTTRETDILVELNLEGKGEANIDTGLHFFNHMLEQIARHGNIDLHVKAKGDLHIDEHHTIEDTAITLGEAILHALGDKRGIERYGFCLPMDEALAQVAIDFGGRNYIVWDAEFKREKVGDLPTEMFFHFFKSFSDAAKCNLNIKVEGQNEHHKIEAVFKAFAKAIKMAVKKDANNFQLPTTKGVL